MGIWNAFNLFCSSYEKDEVPKLLNDIEEEFLSTAVLFKTRGWAKKASVQMECPMLSAAPTCVRLASMALESMKGFRCSSLEQNTARREVSPQSERG